MGAAQSVVDLRVEYTYDPESKNWCFVVPNLNIIGGADTREEAELCAVDAVAFTLEGADERAEEDAEVGYLRVTVQRQPTAVPAP